MAFEQNNIITCEWRQWMLSIKGEENTDGTFHCPSTIYCPYAPCPPTTSILYHWTFHLILRLWCLTPTFSASPLPTLTFYSIILGTQPCRRRLLWKPLGQNGTDWEIHQHFSLPIDPAEWRLWEGPLGSHPGRECLSSILGNRDLAYIQRSPQVTVRSTASVDGPGWWGSVNTTSREEGQAVLLSAGLECPLQLSKYPLGTLLALKAPGGTRVNTMASY